MILKMLLFPKDKIQIKQKNTFLIFRARQGFDLAPTYFHQGWKIRVT